MSIDTKEDWWASCEKHWRNILDIFDRIGADMGRSEEAHWWADRMGEPDTHHEKCLVDTLEDYKLAKQHEPLIRLFNRAFHGAPDNDYIHTWKGWGAFCDLCSEEWVFQPEEPLTIEGKVL